MRKSYLSTQRLLIPTVLLHFSKKRKRPVCLFVNNHVRIQFLEAQQALLAQLSLSQSVVAPLSLAYPNLRLLITRYQLLQQSFQSLAQQPAHWWQWQQKKWKKSWQRWLNQQLQRNQDNLQRLLEKFYQQIKNCEHLLCQDAYHQKIQDICQEIKRLIDNDLPEHDYPLLMVRLEKLSMLRQMNVEKSLKTNQCASSIPCFRRDLLIVLENYVQHYQDKGLRIPKKRAADLDFIRERLYTTKDTVELRESLEKYYGAMWRPKLTKIMTFLDGSFLRRGLRSVLENPDYSIEQLKLAMEMPSFADQAHCQVHNSLFASTLYSDTQTAHHLVEEGLEAEDMASHNELLKMKKQIAELQTLIGSLTNNTKLRPIFLKKSCEDKVIPNDKVTVCSAFTLKK